MKFSVLEEAWKKATLKSEREHVTLYIRNNSNKFRQKNVENDKDLSNMRWTVDEPEDFEFVNKEGILSIESGKIYAAAHTITFEE